MDNYEGFQKRGGKNVKRVEYIRMLNAAIKSKSYRFARQSSSLWLESFPGDMEVTLYNTRALFAEGNESQAAQLLENLVVLDPEYYEAFRMIAFVYGRGNPEKNTDAMAHVHALGGRVPVDVSIPDWCGHVRDARKALNHQNYEKAYELIHQVLGIGPQRSLVDAVHLQIVMAVQTPMEVMQLSTLYHERWPQCLVFTHALADARLGMGDEVGAVQLLHQCVSADAAGQVASRLWGKEHRYLPIWPANLEIQFDLPIPAAVAALLGLNQLPAGEEHLESDEFYPSAQQVPQLNAEEDDAPQQAPEPDLEQVGSDIAGKVNPNQQITHQNGAVGVAERVQKLDERRKETQVSRKGFDFVDDVFQKISNNIRQPEIARQDGRFPVYVIMSSKEGLEKQYGPKTAEVIGTEMVRLSETVGGRPGWRALVFYPDDPENMVWLGLDPVVATDPWKLKLAIVDLDDMLRRRGEMIGALLIVGGAAIVPFHKLPNPTDDIDEHVVSDNPYATLDSNYFVPEWPVGRMPGELGQDAGLILDQLRHAIDYHESCIESDPWWARLIFPLDAIGGWLKRIIDEKLNFQKPGSFGYTAAIWQRSSIAVYRPIGEADRLVVSPPIEAGKLKGEKVANAPLGYYNLHGIEDGPDWYGQRDVVDNSNGPDYPVALRPKDVQKNGTAPQVVFTEACYGSNIFSKTVDDALCLKFISIGTKTLIGSTCIAYGSITSPLIGADLLGYLFWKYHHENCSVGEALMRAKIELAREMNRRQTFLDGEDQKTLLSFVLYGDPLYGGKLRRSMAKDAFRRRLHPKVKTISDEQEEDIPASSVSRETLEKVKKTLEEYLPGLHDADVRFSHQYSGYCSVGLDDKSDPNCKTPKEKVDTGNMVVSLSKQVSNTKQIHRHYARMTLNSKGKMVKLAVSR
jgi:hypothetical protein